jgi:hypothetical protein
MDGEDAACNGWCWLDNHRMIITLLLPSVCRLRRYVVVESDGVTAASWQRGSNNVLALQMNDEEVEVYDNW